MYRLAVIIIYGWLVMASSSHSETLDNDLKHSLAPRLWIPGGDASIDALPLTASHADIQINGPIVQVVMTQHYRNTGTRPINARYVFPGSTHSAVHGLTMKIGERVIQAKIKEKNEAQQLFDQAKVQGKRAALLNQQRPNIFMMDTANLMPGDAIELTLTYSELLVPEAGVYQFVYPTVVGPRYGSNPLQTAADAGWIANPYSADEQGGHNPASITNQLAIHIDSPIAIKDLNSAQHKIETQWHDAKSVEIELAAEETQAVGNRDFILNFRLQDEQIMSGLMTYQQADENYFLVMAQPPKRVQSEQIMPREYLFVLDVSGSMHGFPLDTAKTLMQALLNDLKPHESFNILFFAGSGQFLSPEPLPATAANVQHALSSMQNYQGGGGTELIQALTSAYAMPHSDAIARSIVIVTDGYINAERDAFDLIAKQVNSTNVFTFGIGSSVNRYLLESMAKAGSGEPFIITDPNQATEVSARFRRYIEAPLLTQIQLQGEGLEIYDVEPSEIPVMLAERPIIIFGKYRRQNDLAHFELSAQASSGAYRVVMPLTEAQHDNRADLLPLLWARQRLMRLSDWAGQQVELHRQTIVELALKYSLLSRYTAFIAVDEMVANHNGTAQNVQQPLPLPLKVSAFAVASRPMPEPELSVLIVVSLLIYGLMAGRRYVR